MDISLAIIHHYGSGNVNFTVKNGCLCWDDDKTPEPTAAEIEKWWLDYLDYLSKNEYKEKRRKEYLPIQEQLDLIYWDNINGTTNWKNHIDAVKTKYKKGE